MYFHYLPRAGRSIAACAVIFLSASILTAQAVDRGVNAAAQDASAAANLNVVKVDDVTVKDVLKPSGKPLIVNFWATWCEPCRDEFPELIKIDQDYKGKIDFRIISLDDPVEIDRDVTKFLKEQGSTMTPYLLRTQDETGVIGAISKDWMGALPFTVVYDADGKVRYTRQGLIRAPVVRGLLDQLLAGDPKIAVTELVKVLNGNKDEAAYFYRNNWMALREEALKRGLIDSWEMQTAEPGGDYDFVLITRYKSELQYKLGESNFSKLIQELRPEGPVLVNTLKPNDFRKSVSVSVTSAVGSQ